MDSLNSLIFCFILIVTNLCTTTISGKCPYQSERIPPPNLQDLGDICTPRSLKCDPNNIYYTLNGSCNNLQHSYWGQFSTPFIRLLKANYADGKCSLRVSVTGKPLPLPRLIRTTVLENKEILDQKYNILFYGFGQWLDHDITFQNTNASNTEYVTMVGEIMTHGDENREWLNDNLPRFKCCKNNRPKAYMDPDICIPQINPRNDSFYSTFGLECLEFTRSINTKMMNCDLKPCAPINMATAYLDLSILYGNNATLAIQLRTLKGGKLKVSNNELTNFQEYPTVTAGTECPFGGLSPQDNSYCFKVGFRRKFDPLLMSQNWIKYARISIGMAAPLTTFILIFL